MRLEELQSDLACTGCGERLAGRSPQGPGARGVWQSLGRSVVVTKSHVEHNPGKPNRLVHDEALCFSCGWPLMQRSGGMLASSWRMP